MLAWMVDSSLQLTAHATSSKACNSLRQLRTRQIFCTEVSAYVLRDPELQATKNKCQPSYYQHVQTSLLAFLSNADRTLFYYQLTFSHHRKKYGRLHVQAHLECNLFSEQLKVLEASTSELEVLNKQRMENTQQEAAESSAKIVELQKQNEVLSKGLQKSIADHVQADEAAKQVKLYHTPSHSISFFFQDAKLLVM